MDVDVKISEHHDRVIFRPNPSEITAVRALLSKFNSDIRINRSAEGLWVNAGEVSKIDFEKTPLTFRWTDLSTRFVQNRKEAMKNISTVLSKIKKIKEGGVNEARRHLTSRSTLKVLDDHQVVDVACMTIPESFGLCLFDEQGAGKTVTLIHAFDVLVEKDEVDFALIVAPKSMVSEWPLDFKRFMGDYYKVQTVTGSHEEKAKNISAKSDVLVTNFETTVSMEKELTALLKGYGSRCILVVDESFFAKNLDASRTRSIRRLREYCKRGFVLCGTPAPNSAVDLVQQFNIVDFGATFDNIDIPKEKNAAATVISAVIEERGPFIRHLKADVLPELPNKKFHKVIVQLEPKQSELYNQKKDSLISDLKGMDDVTFERNRLSFLARRTALLQICSNPISIYHDYDEIPAKLLAIDSILEDLISNRKEKVVLWSFYTATIDSMFSRYGKYAPVRYDGTISDIAARREAVRLFRDTDQSMLFIGNPAAAGAGLNLQSAHFAIYESMSNQAAHYLQSLDRIHRRGQKREAEYIVLLCEDTIETVEYRRLIDKERSAQLILGDSVPDPWSRELMLSELLSNKV